jgi:hypothetical protein
MWGGRGADEWHQLKAINDEHELLNRWKTSHFRTLKLDFMPLS